jgi:hypothetical protein
LKVQYQFAKQSLAGIGAPKHRDRAMLGRISF